MEKFEAKKHGCIGTEAGVEAPDKAYLLAVLTEEYMNADDVWDELHTFEWDKKAFMKGRVVNKKARQNVCIADFSQAPDHENKKGTVVDFTQLPVMETLREKLPEEADHMLAEGNFYNKKKWGLAFTATRSVAK